jgi:hypothetical protein
MRMARASRSVAGSIEYRRNRRLVLALALALALALVRARKGSTLT